MISAAAATTIARSPLRARPDTAERCNDLETRMGRFEVARATTLERTAEAAEPVARLYACSKRRRKFNLAKPSYLLCILSVVHARRPHQTRAGGDELNPPRH